jgi:hypothetical protein
MPLRLKEAPTYRFIARDLGLVSDHIRRAAPAHSVVSNRIHGWRRPCEAALRS